MVKHSAFIRLIRREILRDEGIFVYAKMLLSLKAFSAKAGLAVYGINMHNQFFA